MKLVYVPFEKKSGKPICVIDKPDNIMTSKGVTNKWQNNDFVGKIEGIGDITMEWTQDNKTKYGKSCVLTVENFQNTPISTNGKELRNWFCRGSFTQFSKGGKLNKNYDPTNPIITTNSKGKERIQTDKVTYQNVKFSLELNNSISSEKASGATTILRVFEN